MAGELRQIRLELNIPARDLIQTVRTIYPKYDKVLQSKCEHSEVYGVTLMPDALTAVMDKFDPDGKVRKPKKRDAHRLTCRISARLTDDQYQKLQRFLLEDRYATTQDWLTATVRTYIWKKEHSHGVDP